MENEHIGNADQYRVTREVPLPYSFDHGTPADDSDDDEDDQKANEPPQLGAAQLPGQTTNQEVFTESPRPRSSVRLASLPGNGDDAAENA